MLLPVYTENCLTSQAQQTQSSLKDHQKNIHNNICKSVAYTVWDIFSKERTEEKRKEQELKWIQSILT